MARSMQYYEWKPGHSHSQGLVKQGNQTIEMMISAGELTQKVDAIGQAGFQKFSMRYNFSVLLSISQDIFAILFCCNDHTAANKCLFLKMAQNCVYLQTFFVDFCPILNNFHPFLSRPKAN